MAMKIKKGDRVIVISGKDRGVTGKVIEAYPETIGSLSRASTGSRSTRRSGRPSVAARPAASSRRRRPSTSAT